MISERVRPFGTTIFAEMTALAEAHRAINLSQGFPDFDGPAEIVEAAARAMRDGENQYARSRGQPWLVDAIARQRARDYGLTFDPMTEVTVFSGATEGLAAACLGLLNPGDEVVLFEPFYDAYPADAALAGATPRYVTLRFPDFAFDPEDLRRAVTDRTRMIVLNTPMNPTGKVFTKAELTAIAEVAVERDLIVLADEVYEHLTYDDAAHVPIATLPGMRERTITLSSTGKTFSLTGWKIGWATGPMDLIDAAQAAHQFLTFAVATPFQRAMAFALDEVAEGYLPGFRRDYLRRRNFLVAALSDAGFDVAVPAGTYFVLADFRRVHAGDDREFVRWLVEEHGVAAIPPSPFYAENVDEGRRLVRFSFSKRMETLKAAAVRFERMRTC